MILEWKTTIGRLIQDGCIHHVHIHILLNVPCYNIKSLPFGNKDEQVLRETLNIHVDNNSSNLCNHTDSSYINNNNVHIHFGSLPKNLNQFMYFIETLKFEFGFIDLTETWLKPHNTDL